MILENTAEYKHWLSNVQKDGSALNYVPKTLKTEALCLAAIQQDGYALEYVPEALKTEALCLVAVQQNGYTLEFVPEALKTETLCLAAVQKHGYALLYVPEVLRTEALCLVAVKKNGFALRFVPDALKAEAICLAAVQQNGNALEFVIRPNDQLTADADQLASWNRILMEVNSTDFHSKKHLQAQIISPLCVQIDTVMRPKTLVLDEIAILIEHCTRLGIDTDMLNTLYCEKQRLAKPQLKHGLCVTTNFSL